jgi:biotin-dependent carboxylase-like uncharacterized protein
MSTDEPICEILHGGAQTTVQDEGRAGYGAVGVPRAGAMDRFACWSANLALGNAPDAAVLETLLGGLRLRFLAPATIAIAGADLGAVLDGVELANWTAHEVGAGAELHFRGRIWGARAYLAVAGGWAVAPVLGSRSTYLPGGWGGLEGRALRAGDVLHRASASPARAPVLLRPEDLPAYSTFPTIRCVAGPHDHAFDDAARGAFWGGVYRLSPACDRMGYRLEGPTIPASEPALPSAGVVPGCVQIPPDGLPILLMADAQTTGGYPVIATVIGPDLALAAQLLPGDKLRFQPVTLAAANAIARARHAALDAPGDEIEGAPI